VQGDAELVAIRAGREGPEPLNEIAQPREGQRRFLQTLALVARRDRLTSRFRFGHLILRFTFGYPFSQSAHSLRVPALSTPLRDRDRPADGEREASDSTRGRRPLSMRVPRRGETRGERP